MFHVAQFHNQKELFLLEAFVSLLFYDYNFTEEFWTSDIFDLFLDARIIVQNLVLVIQLSSPSTRRVQAYRPVSIWSSIN